MIILFFCIVGAFYVKPANYVPFAPNGFAGISSAAAIIFFAYIGFDAVSTAAEETRNPQRDMPIGMIASLIICTVIYIAVAIVLTGMLNWTHLGTAQPLATAFSANGMNWAAVIVSIGAMFACTSVLMVFQLGQPRIFFSMARDGLLPAVGVEGAPEVADAAHLDDPDRRGRCGLRVLHQHHRGRRADQHRDAVCVRAGGARDPGAAPGRSGAASGRSGRRSCRRCPCWRS